MTATKQKTVRIGCMDYKIYHQPNLKDEKGEFMWGRASHSEMTIGINSDSDPQGECQTFWHEIIHVLIIQSGLYKILKRELQERICDSLAYGILQVLRDNPILAKEAAEWTKK